MLAKDLLSDIIPALHTSDPASKALSWMEIFRISHLPIVNSEEFLGLISDEDIFNLNMADEPIGSHYLSLIKPFVLANAHLYEIIKVVSQQKLTIVPVLDENKKYLGVVTLHDLVQNFANLAAVFTPGAIIVIAMDIKDYSLTHIANIIEESDCKILSSYVTPVSNSSTIELTLKLNCTYAMPVVQSLCRFEYQVKSTFMEDEKTLMFYNDRLESLLSYLNV